MVKFFLPLLLLVFSAQVFGSPCSKILVQLAEEGSSDFLIGKQVKIKTPSKEFPAVFLGKVVELDGSFNDYAFFETQSNTLLLYKKESVQLSTFSNKTLKEGQAEAIIKSMNQIGPYCAAFAAFNCIRLLATKDSPSAKALNNVAVGNESQRTQTLIHFLRTFYHNSRVRDDETMLKQAAKNFGRFDLKVQTLNNTSAKLLEEDILYVLNKLRLPVLLSAYSEKVSALHDVVDSTGQKLPHIDEQGYMTIYLLPKTKNDQDFSLGHVYTLMGSFEAAPGDIRVIVLDSHYSFPRIWPMKIITNNLKSAGIKAYTVVP